MNIQVRHTIQSLYVKKLKMLDLSEQLKATDHQLSEEYKEISWYSPYRLDSRTRTPSDKERSFDEQCIDQAMWYHLVNLYELEKFMLCTDYDKLRADIDNFRTPVFNIENAQGWVDGLQNLILENVKTLVKDVYDRIVNGTYYVGKEKKKRNNSGIDTHFILYTGDHSGLFKYWQQRPSIMDDLEKVCYLLDGKTLPKNTLRARIMNSKEPEMSDDYMTVKVCANGNTHFKIKDDIKNKLNMYGPKGATIGEKIRIKVFE